jgi:membrane protein
VKEKTVKEVEELNKAYFKILANTRASASMMVISWTGVFILALEIFVFYYYFDTVAIINPFMNWFFDLLLISCFYLIIAFFIPLVGFFVYKKQILSIIFLLLVYIVIYFSLQLMMLLLIVTSISTKEFTIGFSLYSPIFIPFLVICTILSFIYQYFWLKRELKKGFSINRTMGNYFAKSSAYSKNSLLLIIFIVSMLGGLLSGKLILIFGILGTLLFSYAFSQLITEVAYLLYLKIQSKEYWEDVPTKKETFRDLFKGFSLKKAKIRIPIEIVSFVIFVQILYKFGYTDQVIRHTRWLLWLIRLFIISIELDILGSFILYVIKKVNTRFKKGKKKQ